MHDFFITSRKLCSDIDFLIRVRDAAIAGVDYIIIREKEIDLKNVVAEIIQIVTACQTKVVIGHNIAIAEEFEDTFLHNSFHERGVNTFSVSVHTLEDVEDVLKTSISYAFIGHIFPTDCKKDIDPKGVKIQVDAIEKTKKF